MQRDNGNSMPPAVEPAAQGVYFSQRPTVLEFGVVPACYLKDLHLLLAPPHGAPGSLNDRMYTVSGSRLATCQTQKAVVDLQEGLAGGLD